MYLTHVEAVGLAESLVQCSLPPEVQCVVLPSMLSAVSVQSSLSGTRIQVGAQNIYWISKGACTGAVSAFLAKEVGLTHTLIGHSEQRYLFGETDEQVGKKVEACDEVGLIPVVGVGETKQDLDEGKRQYRLKKQIQAVLSVKDLSKPMFFAYEPVWAISNSGIGQACLPVDAEDVIGFMKQEIAQYTDVVIPVLYGGSVNEKNISEYIHMPSIDGVLVGSASTKAETLLSMIASMS